MLDLVVRFLLGATVVGLALWVSDNYEARLGGVLSAVPKTSAVSLFVIAYEHVGAFAAETAVSSLYGIAAVIVYATAFALLPRLLPSRQPSPCTVLAVALAAYASIVLPYLFLLDGRLSLGVNLALVATAYAASVVTVGRARVDGAADDERRGGLGAGLRRPWVRYGLPALVGGSLVLGATLAADLLGPVWGGIASVFPANVTAVLVSGSILLHRGDAFEQAAGVPDGVVAAGAFILSLHLLLPVVPLVVAGVVGYLIWGLSAWALSRARSPRKLV